MGRKTKAKETSEAIMAQICMDQAAVAVFVHKPPNTRLSYVNAKACEILGYTRTELLGMSVFDIDPRMTPEEMKTIWETITATGKITFETIQQRKDGTFLPVEITSSLISFGGEEFGLSFAQDISERKKVEEEMRLTQSCFDNAPVGIFRLDSSTGSIMMVNDQTCKMLGYSKEELCRMTVFDIDPFFPKEEWGNHIKQIGENGSRIIERRHRKKNGETYPTEIAINIMGFGGNEYHLAFSKDISDQKQAEAEKVKIQAQLVQAQKMEALGTLAGGIAHDFNNVLGAMLGYAELADRQSSGNPVLSRSIKRIRMAGLRAKDLVRGILAFSRQTNLEKTPVDIGLIVREATDLLKASLPSTIEIQQKVVSGLGMVLADQTQIHQVVMNLCTNAFHAMKETGGVLKLELVKVFIGPMDMKNYVGLTPGRYLDLIVADTGYGMDEKILSHIFDPYFTTKDVDEGTGLGLSVVHGIVEKLGGNIKVYSESGLGTEFHVFFPLMDVETVEEQALEKTALPRGTETILFVDDEKLLADLGQEFLQDLGYEVEIRTSPYEALELVRRCPGKYDAVITDMTMPGMTGDLLVKEIRKIQPGMAVILCTGFSSRLTEGMIGTLDIQGILMKPITYCDLANTVRQSLDACFNRPNSGIPRNL